MNGYIKYFENRGKKMSFNYNSILIKYNEIWNKIKDIGYKISQHVCLWWKYIKAKVRQFNGVIKTNFLGGEVQREGVHCTCIACKVLILSWKWKKKYPQVFLEECKYKIKKDKDAWVYRCWIRVRFKFWFWLIVIFLFTMLSTLG